MSYDFHNEATHKAIKSHKCSMCGEIIDIGEVYIRGSGVFEADFYHYKAHQACNKLRNDVLHLGEYDDGLPLNFGDFEPEGRAYAFGINFDAAMKIYGRDVHKDLVKNGYLYPEEATV